MRIFSGIILFILLLHSCNSSSRTENTLAQVGDKYLYLSDIDGIFDPYLTPEDSLAVLTNYTMRWIRNQLVLKLAENNLSKQEKDVTIELDNYRASLLVYRYEQAYLTQRIDTQVTQTEMEKFYKNNSENFQLTNLLIKALYIQVPNNHPSLSKIRSLFRSNKDKDFAELERICMIGAVKFDAFNNDWVDFNVLAKELPMNAQSYENDLIHRRYLDVHDDNYTYLLNAKDLMMKGGVPPFEHVASSIRTIILNRRKIELINQLEDKIYKEALKRKDFQINIQTSK